MPTDLEIAQAAQPKRIQEIAEKAGIPEGAISPYGQYIAKVDPMQLGAGSEMRAKLILVTAINPTPAGEGKTTVSVGLADGMTKIGKKAMLALREPSLGPVFGMKGGAAGGGRAQVLPMEQINLHFTGDLHAITAANNLLAAMVDNHIQQGNVLGIDPRQVTWRRCLDVNDRQLRAIVSGLGGKPNGNPREDGFDITAASEVMAVFCLAKDLQDLKARLSRLQVARTYSGKPVTAGDLHAAGAMTALLRDALQPNLVQTIDGTPCLMHGGPFANIAHGCNSVIATTTAMRLADYVVTEAGFGADLGAEKFMDIKVHYFEKIGWDVHSSIKDKTPDSYKNFLKFVESNLKNNTPIIVENVDWGGHWRVIIGYDSMGTAYQSDDVLIMADPYDTTDHLQDGYSIVPAERFFYMWFDHQLFPQSEQKRQWLTAKPKA